MKNYTKRITSVVLSLAIAVGATSFTKFGNVNAKEAPLTPQEPTVLNEENAQDTATQTTLGSNYQEATFVTKDGTQTVVDLGHVETFDFNEKIVTMRPTYRSMDSPGHIIYKEGTSCLSITDHGLANHKKVHLWNNKSNKIFIRRDIVDGYEREKGYSLYDDGGSIGLFNAFEVTDKGYDVPHKYLRGHSFYDQCLGNSSPDSSRIRVRYPWQLFDFDIVKTTNVGGRTICLVRWRNYGSNLPIGLKDESSSKNGNEVETKDADAQNLWVIEIM